MHLVDGAIGDGLGTPLAPSFLIHAIFTQQEYPSGYYLVPLLAD